MFEFKREKEVLSVIVSHFIPYAGTWTSTFQNSFGSEHHAALTYWKMREAYEEKVRLLRKEMYERGWKDAKSKKPKQNWFSSRLED